MVDTEKKDWKKTVRERARSGAVPYAKVAITTNTVSNSISILNGIAAVSFAATKLFNIAVNDAVQRAQGALKVTYGVVQIVSLATLPVWSGEAQSAAVAKQAAWGGEWVPDVKSDKLLSEEGAEVKLKSLRELKRKLDKAKTASKKASIQFELFIAKLYTKLLIMRNQNINRSIRGLLNTGVGVTGLASNTNELVDGSDYAKLGLTMATLGLLVAQPIVYAKRQANATSKDMLAKFATMFQIIVMTGKGNFLDANGQVEAKKLDRVMKGPLGLRADYLKAIIEFDQKTYEAAIIAHILNGRQSVDNNDYFELTKIVRKQSAKDLKEEVCKMLGDRGVKGRRTRSAVSRIIYEYSQAKSFLNKINNGDFSFLHESVIPSKSEKVCGGAFRYAITGNSDFKRDDEIFCELKGKVESQVDIGFIHQVSAKIGAALSVVIGGSAGANIIRGLANIAQGVLLMMSPKEYKMATATIGAGQGGLQIIAGALAVSASFGSHKHVNKKARNRERDSNKIGVPNSGGFNLRIKGRVNDFDTLFCNPIAAEDLPQSTLVYDCQTAVLRDSWSQMFAPSMQKVLTFAYFKEKGGELDFSDRDAIANLGKDLLSVDVVSVDERDSGSESESESEGKSKSELVV